MATQLKIEPAVEEPPPANDAEGQHEEAPRDFEAEARAHGWSPKEEFKGDPNRWVDAETFVKRADEVMPLLKAKNARLERDLADLKRQFRQFSRHASTAEDRIRADLQEKMESAVKAGDVEAFKGLQKEANELTGGKGGAQKYSAEEAEEAYDDFREKNAWYDRADLGSASDLDKEARVYADRLIERKLRNTKPGEEPPPAEFFAEIHDAVSEKFPQLSAKTPRPKPQSDVAGAGNGRAQRSGRTYDALPAEAKVKFDKWIANGVIDMGSPEKNRKYCVDTFDWDGWNKEVGR